MFHLLRLCLFVTLFIAGYSAAVESTETRPYYNTSCDAAKSCKSTMCTCLGGEIVSEECQMETQTNCTLGEVCMTAFIKCMNQIASNDDFNVSECAAALSTLRLSLLTVSTGEELFNDSTAGVSCHDFASDRYNKSMSADCVSIPFNKICKTPYVYLAILTLSGDWAWAFETAEVEAELAGKLEIDLTDFLRFVTHVIKMSEGSLVVEFEVECAGNNPILLQQLEMAKTDTTWLAQTKAMLTARGLPTDFTISITEPTTAGPTTTEGQTTTAADIVTTSTETQAVATTPLPTTGASVSWTAAQLLLAIAAVVLLA
jgi:hypothetical protein